MSFMPPLALPCTDPYAGLGWCMISAGDVNNKRHSNASEALNPRPARGRGRKRWLLLIYRVPPEPSSNRIGLWRDLKRLGSLSLQQCVCIVPALPDCVKGIEAAARKIESLGGSYNLFPIRELPPADEARLVDGFRDLSLKDYDEIIEECRTKFVKEIEFERFRENYTYEEAEEIREDLEKIVRWYQRAAGRDWFGQEKRLQVAAEIEECERLLEAFEADVYRRTSGDQNDGPPTGLGAPPALPVVPPAAPKTKRRASRTTRSDNAAGHSGEASAHSKGAAGDVPGAPKAIAVIVHEVVRGEDPSII